MVQGYFCKRHEIRKLRLVWADSPDACPQSSRSGSVHSKPLPNGNRLVDFVPRSVDDLRSKLLKQPAHNTGEDGRLVAGTRDRDVTELGAEQVRLLRPKNANQGPRVAHVAAADGWFS